MKHHAILLPLLLCSCLAAHLEAPAMDHAVQVEAIKRDCEQHREVIDAPPESAAHKCSVQALEKASRQAQCIMHITQGEKC